MNSRDTSTNSRPLTAVSATSWWARLARRQPAGLRTPGDAPPDVLPPASLMAAAAEKDLLQRLREAGL